MDKQILQGGIDRNINELQEASRLVIESEELSKEDITCISKMLLGVAFDLKIISESVERHVGTIKTN